MALTVIRVTNLLSAVRSEAAGTSNGAPASGNHNPPASTGPLLSISKPSWIVRTESNVSKQKVKRPEPPCVVCRGSGRVDCHSCWGRGRTNYVELTVLPEGEWPKWCRTCGGSGLGYCSRCLGTGEYRYIMGFHFMKRDEELDQNDDGYRVRDKGLPDDDPTDPGLER